MDKLEAVERDPWSVRRTEWTKTEVEDDFRDALQSVRVRRPDIATRRELLRSSAALGVAYSFVGFPRASRIEAELCVDLVKLVGEESLPIVPVAMARAAPGDVEEVAQVQDRAGHPVLADIYIPTSSIRARVENWVLGDLLDQLATACEKAAKLGLRYRIAFEDSTRTSPQDITKSIELAAETDAVSLVLNDTVGVCLPASAARHVAFTKRVLRDHRSDMTVTWHGHNDKGLALANALGAIEAGAEVVSGTFTGIGERTGNIPLEQLIYILAENGSEAFDLMGIATLCGAYAAALGAPVGLGAPIIGRDAFRTATGTHAAAIVKAATLGAELNDLVYSGVEARLLGRSQEILIGPGSGKAAVTAVLRALDDDVTPDDVADVLTVCRSSFACFEDAAEVRGILDQTRRLRAERDGVK